MRKVIVKNVKTNAKKEIDFNLVSDYISTKEWKVYEKNKFAINHDKEEPKAKFPRKEE